VADSKKVRDDVAERFSRLFAGLERSHGRYVVPPNARPQERGKLHDKSWAATVHAPITLDLVKEHLGGVAGLGVVPIRDDDTCVFGAIDVDVYPLDLPDLNQRVIMLGLPLVICRTKSGGAHLYLFLRAPATAEMVRGRLMEWSAALGYSGVEVFPKQTHLVPQSDGSWINLPYMGGDRSLRYALRVDGTSMTVLEFLDYAANIAVEPDALRAWELPKAADDPFLDGPPCLQTLAVKGFGDWQNNGMFNVCVYLRKRYEIGWEALAPEYNQRFMSPPVASKDLAGIIKSVRKKTYNYMCKQEPVCGVCNKAVCQTRTFGVGVVNTDPGVVFGPLQKLETDPPMYIWEVDGAQMELQISDLMDQRAFHKLAIAKLNKWPNYIGANDWQKIVRDKLTTLTIIKTPEDATKRGQFLTHLQRFCTGRVRGSSLDELLLGKPFTSEGRTYFCSTDLFQYLTQHRFTGATEREMYHWLRDYGVTAHNKNVKGKFLRYWSVPAFPEQTEDHDVPRAKPPEKM
jgi:hypothetical protein